MSNTFKYIGLHVQQRENSDSPKFFTFYATTSEIKKWSGVRRTAEVEHGAQRIIKPARTKAIQRFLQNNRSNTLPGAIIIGFRKDNPDVIYTANDVQSEDNINNNYITNGTLSITYDPDTEEYLKPGLIVDGQHRVFGAEEYDDEDIPLLVVGILESSVIEEAFQFIVINQKSSKVPTTNIKSIIADIGEIDSDLNARLLESGIKYGENSPTLSRANTDVDSPFFNMLDWELNDRNDDAIRVIPITAVEACIKRIQSMFSGLLDDDESATDVFLNIWSAIKNQYSSLWEHPDNNKLLKKVSIISLTELIVEGLVSRWAIDQIDPLDPQELTEFVNSYIKLIPSDFWTSSWVVTVADNSNIRKMIKDDLLKILINIKMSNPWHQKLKLIKNDQ